MISQNYHFDYLYKYYAMIHAKGFSLSTLLKINEDRENYMACYVLKCLIEEIKLTNTKTLNEIRINNIGNSTA